MLTNRIKTTVDGTKGIWWLRSSTNKDDLTYMYILHSGEFYYNTGHSAYLDIFNFGVAPAFRIGNQS